MSSATATTAYRIRNTSGHLVAVHEHVRNKHTGDKQCYWKRPNGEPGLNGTRLEELPLYGCERLADWPEEYPVILVEGEKAADALNRAGNFFALGTVTGAAGTPGAKALQALRGREVVVWPDADGPGYEHMKRTAERLQGIADEVRLYTWPDAPEKGDAADHPAILGESEKGLGILLNDLMDAPEWHPSQSGGDDPPPDTNGYSDTCSPDHFNLTDMGNAERFVVGHGEDVRYCYPWGKWLTWTGARWERDDGGRVHRLAKETVRGIYQEATAAKDEGRRKAIAKHATRSEAEAKIKAMLELAKSEIPVSPDEIDANPWLLNAPNGTVDLRTGQLRAHRREDLLMKMAGAEYQPDAPAPAWEAFLERVLPGEELRAFVQRGAGYSATGDTSEQCMFINHGPGANGKSTHQEVLAEALGDYAMRAPTEMLMVKRAGGVPNDVARLKGARYVSASETEEGRRLAESLVKDLTGQDTITARFMRAEFFDFKPTHKLWLSTNHKPEIRGTDAAIWRRIRLVPWSVTIPPAERDRKLPEKLRQELAGVLAWVVRGCLEWRREGLGEPEEVRTATAQYRAEQDVLAAFLHECCVQRPEAWVKFADLYGAYVVWCEESGENTETKRRFGNRLTERGFYADRGGKNVPIRRGLALLSDREPEPEGPKGNLQDDGVTQRLPKGDSQNTRKNEDLSNMVTQGYPESDINTKNSSHRGSYVNHGNHGNHGNPNEPAAGGEPQLAAYLADPPAWLVKQAEKVRQNPRFLKPTCSTIGYELYGYGGRGAEIEAAVSEWIAGEAPTKSGPA